MGSDGEGLQRQLEELLGQVEQNHEGIADLGRRADNLESQAEIDRQMIVDLQAQGLLQAEHAVQLEQALKSSRTIGAAIGLLMGSRNLSEDKAFAMLKRLSSDSNRKLRDVAEELVRSADLLRLRR